MLLMVFMDASLVAVENRLNSCPPAALWDGSSSLLAKVLTYSVAEEEQNSAVQGLNL